MGSPKGSARLSSYLSSPYARGYGGTRVGKLIDIFCVRTIDGKAGVQVLNDRLLESAAEELATSPTEQAWSIERSFYEKIHDFSCTCRIVVWHVRL